ncbi:MAG TPA: hypothetical protein PKB09_04520 [Candidatus Saccharibacteria bacterium]|jgi:hypothetical protein|nr:hypothetical protein [Candidatus Saccharibacteria bacterium]
MNSVNLTLLLLTSLVSALNPYSLGLFILVLTYLLGSKKTQFRYSLILIFIVAYFSINLAVSCFCVYLANNLAVGSYNLLSWIVAVFATGFGLVQLKQYFWSNPKVGIIFTSNFNKKAKAIFNQKNRLLGLIWAGAISAIIALPFTIVGFTTMVIAFNLESELSLRQLTLIYNLIYIIPLLVITMHVANKTKISTVKNWFVSNKQIMRLSYSVLCISLAWILILSIKGTIDLG